MPDAPTPTPVEATEEGRLPADERAALDSYVGWVSGIGWTIPIPSEVYRVAFLAGVAYAEGYT